jgi:S-DNA-T family DNA segregation ATPase FtsK/SpoIIIE
MSAFEFERSVAMAKQTSRQVLEFQSDRIEAVLAQHKVAARVMGGKVSPRWIQFQVMPAVGAKVSKIKGLAEELALALGSETCRVSRQGGMVSVEIPRSDPKMIKLLPLQHRLQAQHAIPFGTALLGLAEDGAPLMVRLPSPQVAHILVAGTTGSGKSALAKTIIASLALGHRPSQMGFVLIDPKRRAFGPLAGLPHLLRPVLSKPATIESTLQTLVELMLTRDREGRVVASATQNGEPRVVVVIDELADLLMTTGRETQTALTRLTQRGREAGIHLIACTQKPASQVVGSLAKANFPVRLVGRVTSPEDAKVATGYAGTGAERLRGPGDFIVVNAGQVTRFQVAYISPQEMATVVGGMFLTDRERGAVGPAEYEGDSEPKMAQIGSRLARLSPANGAGSVKLVTDGLRRRFANRPRD